MNRGLKNNILVLLPALCQPLTDGNQYFRFIYIILITIFQPPLDPLVNIRNLLFSNDSNIYEGRDVFRLFRGNRFEFYNIT